ncbi:MAG: recombinase family protein [Candidatus Aegiribacteria sp.]|nr:recombinase family protein [Candidatus Aegiribacteria sp.]
MLKNKIYYGDFDWNEVTYSGKHQPIVSRQLWQKVQDTMLDRNSSKIRRMKHDFAFSRLLRCGHCGCMMTGELKKGKYIYYHCTGYKGKCNEPYTRETVLDSLFCDFLGLLEFNQEVIDFLRDNYLEMSKKKRSYRKKAISILQAEYDKLQVKLDTMYEDKLEGIITPQMFNEKSQICRNQMEDIFSAIVKHESEDPAEFERSVDLLELIRNARTTYSKRDSSEKRRLLNNLLSNCLWKGGNLSVEFRHPYDMIVDTNRVYEAKKAEGNDSNSLFELWYARQDSNLWPAD